MNSEEQVANRDLDLLQDKPSDLVEPQHKKGNSDCEKDDSKLGLTEQPREQKEDKSLNKSSKGIIRVR